MSLSPSAATAPVIAAASAEARLAYLRKVLGLTFLGLLIAGVTGFFSMVAIASNEFLLSGIAPIIIILACWAVTNFVAPRLVFGNAKAAGFLLGTVADGIALGFILLVAAEWLHPDHGAYDGAVDIDVAGGDQRTHTGGETFQPAVNAQGQAIAGRIDGLDDLVEPVPGEADYVKDRAEILVIQLA